MPLVPTDPPALEPITKDELKLQCRLSGTTEDTLLDIYIAAARSACEQKTGRALIEQSWTLTLPRFGTYNPVTKAWEKGILLPRPRVMAISTVTYMDEAGDSQTMDVSGGDAEIYLDTATGILYPVDDAEWPTVSSTAINPVAIEFTAGFGDTAADVPNDLRAWILLTAATLYAQRESLDSSGRMTSLPDRFWDSLLDRWVTFGGKEA